MGAPGHRQPRRARFPGARLGERRLRRLLLLVAAKKAGGAATQAGAHPYALEADLALETEAGAQRLRDLTVQMPPGLLVNPGAVGECTDALFHRSRSLTKPGSLSGESCPDSTQVGVIEANVGGTTRFFGLFNLVPPFGTAAAIGAAPFGTPLVFAVRAREGDSGLDLRLTAVPPSLDLRSLRLTIWGTPWWGDIRPSETHDPQRGNCLDEETGGSLASNCQVMGPGIQAPESQIKSYLTLPTTPCGTPPAFQAERPPGRRDGAGRDHDPRSHRLQQSPHDRQGAADDRRRRRAHRPRLQPRRQRRRRHPQPRRHRPPGDQDGDRALPEGLTINPSLGAGLGTCSEADFARESAGSEPGAGCPNGSKIGAVTLEGALGLAEPLQGSVYLATPYANPTRSLLAVYLLARSPRRGLIVKSQGKIEPDPHTGALTATFEDLPRLLYTHFALTLREGQRSTLISPTACGSYKAGLQVASWADPTAFAPDSSFFAINHGEGGGACPGGGGVPPFAPGLVAGSVNPTAAAHTPFYLRMTRTDGEQEIASYSASFPPGLLARLAGVAACPDAAIAAAKGRSGAEELAAPSCPASSLIGHTEAGYGVGGSARLGARQSLPRRPLPRRPALHGGDRRRDDRPLRPRHRRRPLGDPDRPAHGAGVDRLGRLGPDPPHPQRHPAAPARHPRQRRPPRLHPQPDQLRSHAGLLAARRRRRRPLRPRRRHQRRLDPALPGAELHPARLQARARAAPHGRHPARRLPRPARHLRPAAEATPTSPPSPSPCRRAVFLAQSHLRDVCTRVQFAKSACPAGSVYGHARAITPLMDEPLEGPVYLRSSHTAVPDLVADLHGRGIEIEVPGRIDSSRAGIRANFECLPDAPVTKFTLLLDGGKHGLLATGGWALAKPQHALGRFIAHSNATEVLHRRAARAGSARSGGGDEALRLAQRGFAPPRWGALKAACAAIAALLLLARRFAGAEIAQKGNLRAAFTGEIIRKTARTGTTRYRGEGGAGFRDHRRQHAAGGWGRPSRSPSTASGASTTRACPPARSIRSSPRPAPPRGAPAALLVSRRNHPRAPTSQ